MGWGLRAMPSFPLQLIPQVSSLSWFTTIVPLVLVLAITAVKDATDDYVSASILPFLHVFLTPTPNMLSSAWDWSLGTMPSPTWPLDPWHLGQGQGAEPQREAICG